jgi:hypothetical protein
MVSAYLTRCGFVSIELFPQGQRYNSQFVTQRMLPIIGTKLPKCHLELRATPVHLRIDNARPHTSKIRVQKTEELGFIQVTQPAYSPDIALHDFFLFGDLKGQ